MRRLDDLLLRASLRDLEDLPATTQISTSVIDFLSLFQCPITEPKIHHMVSKNIQSFILISKAKNALFKKSC